MIGWIDALWLVSLVALIVSVLWLRRHTDDNVAAGFVAGSAAILFISVI